MSPTQRHIVGKEHEVTRREEYAKSKEGKVIILVRDFMEKMGISANNGMKFQYFMKLISLGSRRISVFLLRPGQDKYETRLYTVLSIEKRQNRRIVYCNTEMILNKIVEDLPLRVDKFCKNFRRNFLTFLSDYLPLFYKILLILFF